MSPSDIFFLLAKDTIKVCRSFSSLQLSALCVCSCERVFADVSFFSGTVMNTLSRYGGQRSAKKETKKKKKKAFKY